MTIETKTPSTGLFYKLVRDLALRTRPWQSAIRYQTKPDERNNLPLVSQRVYGRRDEFLAVAAAAGLDSIEQGMSERLLTLPTEGQLQAFKDRAGFKNLDADRK